MSFPEDLQTIKRAKKENPALLVGLCDPRNQSIDEVLHLVDFIVVDSIEMRDYFARYGLPLFSYVEYPLFEPVTKIHEDTSPVVIGYHGNKVHLMGMYPEISAALDELAKRREVEFWAMYNIASLGKWRLGLPRRIPVRHLQWSEESYVSELSKVDIGIVPNMIPVRGQHRLRFGRSLWSKIFLEVPQDYLMRFKMYSNAGRAIVFARLGIPVVSDMYPSALQLIRHGKNGYLAHSKGGWLDCLERLADSHELRNRFARELATEVEARYGYDVQNKRLAAFLSELLQSKSRRRSPPVEAVGESYGRTEVLGEWLRVWADRIGKRLR